MTDLDALLGDWLARAQAARALHDERTAALVEQIAREVQGATEEYRRRLSEREAANWSGRSVAWLRRQFPAWQAQGHAWKQGRERTYRALIVPKRVNLEAVKDDARRAAREAAAVAKLEVA